MNNYPYPKFSSEVNGKKVNILPVKHIEEFLRDYRKYIVNFVQKNEVLVLEPYLDNNAALDQDFFGEVIDIAATQQKKFYTVDPTTTPLAMIDLIGSVMFPYTAYHPFIGLNSQEKHSRRQFLKKSFVGLTSSYLFAGTSLGREIQHAAGLSEVSYDYDDQFLVGILNFRDLIVAEGLERLCTEITTASSVGLIMGALHSGPVHAYLEHPELRKKKLLYKPLEFIAEMRIKEYTPVNGRWELKIF